MFGREWLYQWLLIIIYPYYYYFLNSLSTDYPTGRILRDARLYTVGAGTQEIRRMLIGREFNNELLR